MKFCVLFEIRKCRGLMHDKHRARNGLGSFLRCSVRTMYLRCSSNMLMLGIAVGDMSAEQDYWHQDVSGTLAPVKDSQI